MAAQATEVASSVKGTVRDEQGTPLPGATVTLTDHQAPGTTKQTKSGRDGEYSFSQVSIGEQTVSAALEGYESSSVAIPRLLESRTKSAKVDLTLTHASSATNSSAAKPNSASRHPPLQFEASGIHGLIDPGGYSASASADAAPGMLRGIADVKRSGGNVDSASVNSWPCELEPKLLKAVLDNPDHEEALRSLGQFYVAHHQPAKALPLLERASQINATDYEASRDIGVALLQSGEFGAARTQFASLIERNDRAELHQLLAKADEGSGMFRQAAEEYKRSNMASSSEEALFGVGYEWLLAGSPAEALNAFEAGLEKYPRSVPLHIGTGAAQFLLSQFSSAVNSFLGAVDVDPADPRPYSFLAAASGLSADQHDRVREAFRRFSEINPNSAEANYYYALSLVRQVPALQDHIHGEAANPETLLKTAINLDPAMAKAHLELADVYVARNDYQAALPEYEAAVRLDPALSEAHYRLAIAYKRAGHPGQSAREMQLFQNAKAAKPFNFANQDFDIAQFISVIDTPTRHASETECKQTVR
ncbi:MAG TPA: tetratricopeptide repeat protein [Acidisarcina sp.]